VAQPPAQVERMTTVSCTWDGGDAGRDRPVDDPFVRVERRTAGGWQLADDDLGTGMVWREQRGRHTARWDVPADLPLGTYRFRITAARYTLEGTPFEVVASTRLRLLGVEREPVGAAVRLTFAAQQPAPDPERDVRTRAVHPDGGVVRFRLGAQERTASWDGWGWSATVPAVGDGETVEDVVLVDGLGNSSGAPRPLTIGGMAPVEWPPSIGPAGGRPPGPLGIGTFPP
jgi:neutral ceramidase